MKLPPFLLAAALAFWGWQTGHLFWGLAMGAALEASRATRARWEFSDGDLSRVWYLCLALVCGAGLVLYSTQDRMVFVFKFAQTLPVCFFPLMLAQAFGNREEIPWSVFTGLLRRTEGGLAHSAANVSFIYYAICIVATSASTQANEYFYYVIVGLVMLALASVRSRRQGMTGWVALALAAAIAGSFGSQGLQRLQSKMETMLGGWIADLFHPVSDTRECQTSIGRPGRIRLSSKIALRVTPETAGLEPRLLCKAVYDTYKNEIWSCSSNSDFSPTQPQGADTFLLMPAKPCVFEVDIAGYFDEGTGALALPRGAFRLRNVPAFLYTNRLGSAQIQDGPGLLTVKTQWGPGPTMGAPPISVDLRVPDSERLTLSNVCAALNLGALNERQKLRAINRFFQENFTYSLDIPYRHLGRFGGQTPLSAFLTDSRMGHCEYFATATVLLLRQAGVPARYAIGYAVPESARNGSTYLVREKDAHAWALAYRADTATWEEVDNTPASWEEAANQPESWWERLSDFGSNLYFRYSEWRWSKTSVARYASWLMAPLILYLVWRIVAEQRGRSLAGADDGRKPAAWPGLDSELYEIDRQLAVANLSRRPEETLAFWQRRLEETLPDADRLRRIFELHRALRFDPDGLSNPEREALKHEAERWISDFRARNPLRKTARLSARN